MDLNPRAIPIYVLTFASVYLLVRYGWAWFLWWWGEQERHYDQVLNVQLLMNSNPRHVMILTLIAVFVIASMGYALGGIVWFIPAMVIGFMLPWLIVKHMFQKRLEKLNAQLVDGITSLASGVRAGLTLVQSMELLVANHIGPMKQEISQLLREYHMGLDLNQAMRNTANRIGLSNYRLLFTAIEMHRVRGGNTGESLDRIAESIREIQRLEGKLDAITAQGRFQARAIALAPIGLLVIYYFLDPKAVEMLFVQPIGRMVLLLATLLILGGYMWIKKIMSVDI